MEEAEARRARLRAMRADAEAGAAQPDGSVGMQQGLLPAPLFENAFPHTHTDRSSLQRRSRHPAKFDFYTDPMAGFSRGSLDEERAGVGVRGAYAGFPSEQGYLQVQAAGVRSQQQFFSGAPNVYGAGSFCLQQSVMDANHGAQNQERQVLDNFRANSSVNFPSQRAIAGAGNLHQQPFGGRGNGQEQGFRVGNRRQGGERWQTEGSQGRGGRSSPSQGGGRGAGRIGGMESGSGAWRGAKAGRYGEASARERPDLYYNKSMIEDPWEALLREFPSKLAAAQQGRSGHGGQPKLSTSSKKGESMSGPSLADNLAGALAEAMEEASTS